MATYGPGDEVNDVKQFAVYDVATGTSTNFDFGAAGYAANAILNVVAQHQVQLFGSTSPVFASNNVTVDIGGVATLLDGTGLAFFLRHSTDVTKTYRTYNMPATAGVYYFKAVFGGTNEADQLTLTWSHTVSALP